MKGEHSFFQRVSGWAILFLVSIIWLRGEEVQSQGFGYALTFNGTNQYVSLPYGNTTSTSVTIEFWFRTTATQTACMFGQSTLDPPAVLSGAYIPAITLKSNGTIRAEYWDGTTGPGITTTSSYNDGKYHHLAFVGNVTVQTLYIDGVSQGTSTTTTIDQSWWTHSTIGVGYGTTGYGYSGTGWSYFPGTIDEVCIWNDARTLAEIQSNMASGIVGNEAGLAAY